MSLEKNVLSSIEKLKNVAYSVNYDLANNPEISGKEFRSVKQITELLSKYGIESEIGSFGIETSFYAKVIEKGESFPNIAILVEYDALPEIGHGCGHSASAAISILSALALKDNEEIVNANIDLIGTPDEEDAGLKIPMADNGVFDKYDMAIMVHLDTKNVPNWKMLAFETYEIEFKGKPAHTAASPWDGRSALDGLMLAIHAFDMMRKSLKRTSVVEGIITEGGKQPNILPETARAKYTFRSDSSRYVREEIMPWVNDILQGSAMASQTKSELIPFGYKFSDMNYLDTGVEMIKEIMEENNMPYVEMKEALGSSDMGNVSYRCPSFHPSVAITFDDVALHTKEFASLVNSEKSESCIVNGAKIIDMFICRLLENPEKLKEIREEFIRKTK